MLKNICLAACLVMLALSAEAAQDVNAELIEAAKKGGVPAIKAAISRGADVNARGVERITPLIAAAAGGHIETVSLLLASGAEINAREYAGRTALMFAVYNNHPPVVSLLLAKGADVNLGDNNRNTPLMIAAQIGSSGVARALIAKGAKLEAKEHKGLTPLILAASHGRTIVVKELLAKGADVNAAGNEGMTALMFAAGKGHLETVKALLAAGADVKATSSHGGTALIAAEGTGHTEIAQLLRQAEQSASGKPAKPGSTNQSSPEPSPFDTMPSPEVTEWLRDKIATLAIFPEFDSVVGVRGWEISGVKFDGCALSFREAYTISLNILGYYSSDRVNKEYSLSLADVDPARIIVKRKNGVASVPLFTAGGKKVQRKMLGGKSDGEIAMEDNTSFSFRDSELADQVARAFKRAVGLCRPPAPPIAKDGKQKPQTLKSASTRRRNKR